MINRFVFRQKVECKNCSKIHLITYDIEELRDRSDIVSISCNSCDKTTVFSLSINPDQSWGEVDSAGNKIFENDFIIIPSGYYGDNKMDAQFVVVKWDDDGFYADFPERVSWKDCLVVGNKYEGIKDKGMQPESVTEGDYIEYFDAPYGKFMNGWVTRVNGNYIEIKCDDSYGGCRGTSCSLKDVIRITETKKALG